VPRAGLCRADLAGEPQRAEMGGLPCFPDMAALPSAPDAVLLRSAGASHHRAGARTGRRPDTCWRRNLLCRRLCRGRAEGAARQAELLVAAQRRAAARAQLLRHVLSTCSTAWRYAPDTSIGGLPIDAGKARRHRQPERQSGARFRDAGARDCRLAMSYRSATAPMSPQQDLIEALVQDERVSAIGLHLEGLGSVSAVLAGLPCCARGRGAAGRAENRRFGQGRRADPFAHQFARRRSMR